MAAEIKLLVAAPSAKNWPLALAGGVFLILTAVAGFALQATGLNESLLTAATGVALTVFPMLRAANTAYLVTNQRVSATTGLFGGGQVSVPLAGVKELRLRRSAANAALRAAMISTY